MNSQTSRAQRYTPEVRDFFKNLVRIISEGGVWVCHGGAYIVSHTHKTFTLFKRSGMDNIMLNKNAEFIPRATGYHVKDDGAN